MAYRRGFKTEANTLAEEIRFELGLRAIDALDPRLLADHLAVDIIDLSSYLADTPAVACLLTTEQRSFSAATVFCGPCRTIVHNDSHSPARQNSNLSHELAHSLLQHPATPALDDKGCRDWNQDIEDEAEWLSGILLVSEEATLAIARGSWTKAEAAEHFCVSPQMIQRRVNATGAVARVNRAQNYGRRR